jgi:hypothetical protein
VAHMQVARRRRRKPASILRCRRWREACHPESSLGSYKLAAYGHLDSVNNLVPLRPCATTNSPQMGRPGSRALGDPGKQAVILSEGRRGGRSRMDLHLLFGIPGPSVPQSLSS